ncbi:MAG: CarD family transcriptional regulator [Deltaproteobacteria bacterium]|nr:CarD family transcriptional regulator [Deltaproteobacteria bacterium]
MFRVGDLAVYPAHGVGIIESLECKAVMGEEQDFYIMRILDSGMIIMIPIKNAGNVGLRQLISKEEINQVYRILEDRTTEIDNQTWNRRYREYMEKIKTGSLFEVAEVLRDLSILKSDKDLSFGERKMLDTARNLLVKEIALATEMEENQIEKQLNQIFKS